MPRRPKSRPKILAAAIDELAGVGAEGLKLDRITAKSETNKRMIYHYFGDRAGLVRVGYAHCISILISADEVSVHLREFLHSLGSPSDRPAAHQSLPEEGSLVSQATAARALLLKLLMGRIDADERRYVSELLRLAYGTKPKLRLSSASRQTVS